MLTHTAWDRTFLFVLVHNGWSNYLEQGRIPAGHHFKGQTDTEIAVHLIGKFVEIAIGLSVLEAFKKLFTSSVVPMPLPWLTSEKLDVIYVAKNKSPLWLVLRYNMARSDAMAMIRETNQYMEIHDQELVSSRLIASKHKTMMAIVVSVLATLLNSLTCLIL